MKVIYIFLTFNQNQIKEDGTVFLDQASTFCDLLASAGITSLFNTRLQEIAIFMFKTKNKLLPTNRLDLFPHSQADYHIPRVRTFTYGKHWLRFFWPYFWSKLSISDRNEISRKKIKKSIRKKDFVGWEWGGGGLKSRENM